MVLFLIVFTTLDFVLDFFRSSKIIPDWSMCFTEGELKKRLSAIESVASICISSIASFLVDKVLFFAVKLFSCPIDGIGRKLSDC